MKETPKSEARGEIRMAPRPTTMSMVPVVAAVGDDAQCDWVMTATVPETGAATTSV